VGKSGHIWLHIHHLIVSGKA